MVLELLQGSAGNAGCEIWLLMGSPYTSDLIYHELFLDLAAKYRNFHYRQAISREPGPDGSRGIYVDVLIEREIDRLGPLLADERTLLYLCGLTGMQDNVFGRLQSLGLLDAYAEEARRHLRPTARCMVEVY